MIPINFYEGFKMIDFKKWKKIHLPNSTVDFYENEEYLAFDSTQCPPPEPMINARVGLNNLKKDQKLIMINHRNPLGLLPSVSPYYEIECTEENGVFQLIFTKKPGLEHEAFDESCKDHP